MSTLLTVCRVCLHRNSQMRNITVISHLQTTFEKLTGTKLITNDGKPNTLCYICYALLQKCWKFRERSRKASKLLTKLLGNQIRTAQETISILDKKFPHTLSISTTNEFISMTEFIKNENPEVFVKEEMLGNGENIAAKKQNMKGVISTDSIRIETNSLKQESNSLEPDDSIDTCTTVYNEETNPEAIENYNNKILVTKSLGSDMTACDCNRSFKKEDNLQNHTSHEAVNSSTCLKCLGTNNQINLQNHLSIRRFKELHVCDLCGKTYFSKYSLKVHITHTHMKMVIGKKAYQCDSCNKSFNHRGTLRLHMRIHTGDKPYACDKCSKTFSQKGTLQRHNRMHTGERPYACHECTKTFNQESSLKRHIKMHNGEKSYACSRCDKSYYESSHLTRHMRTHTGEKPFACDRCFQTFSQSSNLKAHMKKHTGTKASNYICHECNKTFDHKSIFKRHVLKHTREKPYPCDLCDKKYADKRTLQRHIATHD